MWYVWFEWPVLVITFTGLIVRNARRLLARFELYNGLLGSFFGCPLKELTCKRQVVTVGLVDTGV